MQDNLEPLFDVIMSEVPGPEANTDAPLQMLVTNLDFDEHKGRIALGRITAGYGVASFQSFVGSCCCMFCLSFSAFGLFSP
jgi:predicted membrane GTPase involved in stress response